MNKSKSFYAYDRNLKDSDVATNTCSTESNCIQNVMGKFFRKPDVTSKVEKKKKSSNGQVSLMCYLTPKNCQQSAKLIKQKILQCRSQIDINAFSVNPNNQQSNSRGVNKSKTKQDFKRRERQGETSLEKQSKNQKDNYRLKKESFGYSNNVKKQKLKNSAPQQTLSKAPQKKTSMRRLFNQGANLQVQHTQTPQPLSVTARSHYQKQLLKMKNQCQHYTKILQTNSKQTSQLKVKLSQVQKDLKELKVKNGKLLDEKQKEIGKLKQLLKKTQLQNLQLKQKCKDINQQNVKKDQQVSYLKENIRELNQRMNQLLNGLNVQQFNSQANILPPSSAYKNSNNRFNSFTNNSNDYATNRHFNSFNSTQLLSNSANMSSSQDQGKLIHQLQNELKYSQVQINMLKRIKLDINKKNQQFIKLQRQNRILKNQIFQMKTSNMIDDAVSNNTTGTKGQKLNNGSVQNQYNEYKNTTSNRKYPMRGNFQINLEIGSRSRQNDKRSQSCSSDTLSLNLSLSPEKQRRQSKERCA